MNSHVWYNFYVHTVFLYEPTESNGLDELHLF